jgi:hypothetical protein
VSGVGTNANAFTIDVVAPTLVRFTSTTPSGTYGPAASIALTAVLSEVVQAGAELDVTLDTGAVVKLTAPAQGTTLGGTYRVEAGQNTGDLTVSGFTAGSVLDLAGNPMTATRLPTGVDNLAGSKDIVVDTVPPNRPTIADVSDDIPQIIGTVPNGGITNDSRLLLSGTTPSGTTVRIFTSDLLLGSATVIGTTWSFTTPALSGGTTYSFTARATDAVGNEGSDSSPYEVTIDLDPPGPPQITGIADDALPLTGIVANGGFTNDTTLTLSGTTTAATAVQVFNGDTLLGSATVTGTNWTFTTGTLATGFTYVFVARATDTAGNSGPNSSPYTVTVDTSGPSTLITGAFDDVAPVQGNVAEGGFSNDPRLLLTGITEAGSTLQVFDGVTLLGAATIEGTSWRFTTAALVDGTRYSFRVQATDAAGNVGPMSAARSVTIDTRTPEAPVVGTASRDFLSGSVEQGCSVEVFLGTVSQGFAVVTDTTWAFSLSHLIDGLTYDLTARSIDQAGNVSADSSPFRLTIDRTAPVSMILDVLDDAEPSVGTVVNGGITNDIGLVLRGNTTEDGCIVEVFNGTVSLGFATVVGTTWSFVTDALVDGTTSEFKVRATDRYDNQGTFSHVHAVTIDNTAPAVRLFESTAVNGVYNAGRAIVIRALMREVVSRDSFIVTTLDTGALVELRARAQGDVLEGTYTIQPGHSSADLTVVSFNAGFVTDRAGNVLVDLTMPTAAENIGGPKNIIVDTTSPTIRSFASSAAAGFYRQAGAIDLSATPSETLLAGTRIGVTLNTGAVVTLTATPEGTSLVGTYVVAAAQNTSSLAVVSINPLSGGDLAGNPITATVPSAGNLRPGIVIDTLAPTITRFDSTSPNGTYRPGGTVTLRAFASESLQPGAVVNVTLNSGVVVALTAATGGQTLTGTYTVQAGEVAADLDVVSMAVTTGRDAAGNVLTGSGTVLPGNRLADGHDIRIDGAISIFTPTGFSSDPLRVPNLGRNVTSIAIRFNTPVTGVTLANFTLLYNNRPLTGGRSVSLRGATITGSGADYVLRLPSRTASMTGIYTLQVNPAGIVAVANGKPMTDGIEFYWGRGRSISPAAVRATATGRR